MRPATPRIIVTRGGPAEPDALRAVALALARLDAMDAGASSLSAWRRAALLEGVGGAPMEAPDDLAPRGFAGA